MVAFDRLTDPAPTDAMQGAAAWLLGTLGGTVANVMAVVAAAIVGLLMLSGRVDWRRGMAVGLGCFLLFGAGAIADGLLNGTRQLEVAAHQPEPQPTPVATPTSGPYDPYAGAAPSR